MPLNIQDSRMIQKYSTVSGQVPTVAPTNDHTDGTWSVVDVYAGELMANVNNSRLWMRMTNGIREILVSKDNSANGDLYFYNNSAWQKLAIGSSGQVLTVSGGVPTWETGSGGGGGSGTVTSIATAGLISGGTITSAGTITTSMSTNKLVGRATAGTGIMEELDAIPNGITATTQASTDNSTKVATTEYVKREINNSGAYIFLSINFN